MFERTGEFDKAIDGLTILEVSWEYSDHDDIESANVLVGIAREGVTTEEFAKDYAAALELARKNLVVPTREEWYLYTQNPPYAENAEYRDNIADIVENAKTSANRDITRAEALDIIFGWGMDKQTKKSRYERDYDFYVENSYHAEAWRILFREYGYFVVDTVSVDGEEATGVEIRPKNSDAAISHVLEHVFTPDYYI